jgi:hypothetical protein
MHSSISVILLDAKRGTVIAPISLHSLSACECLIALGSFRNAQFGETLGTTFYSIRQPDRSPIPIAYGRGHPFEPIAGSSLAELPPQGINVATKRLHQEYRRRSPTTAAATAKLLALPGGPADGGVVWLCNQAEFYACSRSQKGDLPSGCYNHREKGGTLRRTLTQRPDEPPYGQPPAGSLFRC